MKFAVSLAAAILMFTTTIGIALAISPIQGFLPIRSIGTAGDPSTGFDRLTISIKMANNR
jgi:hypothetical protein